MSLYLNKTSIMYNNRLRTILFPVILAFAVVLGMVINSLMSRQQLRLPLGSDNALPMQGSKLDMIMNMINYSYVDTVDIRQIEEDAIPQIIKIGRAHV